MNARRPQRAQKALGARTTSETVQKALDMVTEKAPTTAWFAATAAPVPRMPSRKTRFAVFDTSVYVEDDSRMGVVSHEQLA